MNNLIIAVMFVGAFVLSGATYAAPISYADGDLAPLGVPNSLVDYADYLVATRIVAGELAPTELEISHGDIYPAGSPDGVINIQDLLLLQQRIGDGTAYYVENLTLFVEGPATVSGEVDGNTASTTVTVDGYTGPGAVVTNDPNLVDPADSSNTVWHVAVSGGIANAYLGTVDLSGDSVLDTGFDLSGAGEGQLVFDIKVNSLSAGAVLTVKIDSGYPDLGQVQLSGLTIGSWQRIAINFADLLANPGPGAGLDLENVVNVFVIEVTGGSADVYLDNIFITHSCADVGGCNATIKTKPSTGGADTDSDGVPDSIDQCPATPTGTLVDATGCAIVIPLLSATATASSTGAAGGASLAVDGNLATRWESAFGVDPSWITLDLGASYSLSKVIIHWEAANAATYQIQGSEDNSDWTVLSSQSGGVFGDRTDNVTVSGSYRYVRMYGQTRAPDPLNGGATYGYSIWEMEVYGLPAADEDGDGVDDSVDQCPGTPAGSNVDATGCIIADSDGDGVPDSSDLCPGTPAGSTVDSSGCIVIIPVNEVASVNGILVGGSGSSQPGFALYVSDDDLAAPGTSTCNSGCVGTWPPLLVTDGVATGVTALGTIVRTDSTIQATHNGRPLYYYVNDSAAGQTSGDGVNDVWHIIPYVQLYTPLFDQTTPLEPVTSYVRGDGVVVTRFGDRGRDRHAKDIGYYDPANIQNSDHYDHYLAQYWHYRTARIQLEDHVPNGQSLIRATYITENRLGAKEFRVWFSGVTTTGQFHFNPTAVEIDSGTFDDDFVKTSSSGNQWKYTIDITEQWKNVATFNEPLQVGVNMEFEISQFLVNPPAGTRLNYYGTSYVYVIGSPGLAPFEWERGVNNPLGVNDGTPIPAVGLLGGDTTLGYNYSEEPAGRFMQMATNLSHVNAQPFVRGRRVHHTNFVDGSHDERDENPIWPEQVGKAGNHYINASCANCHVRNGRALVADVGQTLDKWVFKVGDDNGDADPAIGKVLQPNQTGAGAEGTVTLGAWTDLANGLRAPNYVFSNGAPARFSARIAPQLVGIGLLEAVPETEILAWEDPTDSNGDGISGRASQVNDPVSGVSRLGRFGYKAATSSVEHQVAVALNTDIGVMTSVLPIPDCGSSQTTCGTAGSELADNQLADLVKYISLLGVGARRDYDVTTGETLFNVAGCGGCHRATLTTSDYHPLNELRSQTIHPYTDLLLHDMGAGLADNHGEGSANGAEWRTAPLWGLGHARSVMLGDAKANDSVTLPIDPNDVNRIGYLHDGRARTIDEAIRWHGGEAEAAKQAYEALSGSVTSQPYTGDKGLLMEFLESL